MKQRIVIFIILSIFCSCIYSRKEDDRNEIKKADFKNEKIEISKKGIDKNCNKFYFKYDNNDNNSFGIEYFSGDEPIAPSSLIIFKDFVFITDPYHNSIKRFSLKTKELRTSQRLSQKNIWLNDIMVFNNRVYVTSNLDSLYIFTPDLVLLERKWINKGEGSFYSLFKDSLILYYPVDNHKFITLNNENKIINVKYGYKSRAELLNGKLFKILGNDNIETIYGKRKIKDLVKKLNYFLDYDSLTYDYFYNDTTSLVLNICNYD